LRVAAITTDGQLLEKITLGVKVAMGRDYVIGEMCDAIHSLTDKYRGIGTFVGAGIGVPGIIDVPAGIMRKSANLPGWTDYPVREVIEKRLQTHIFLDNDANVAALGEKWMGAGRDVDNMAMLTLGTGIGGAIILNGKIFYGMSGMAGEFGHITVEPDGVLCGCGNHGCSERYASASAVVRMAREAVQSGKAPGLTKAFNADPEFSARSVYNLAIQGDPDAKRIFEAVVRPTENGQGDVDAERARLAKEIQRSEKMLANEKFVANAAPDVVEGERQKLAQYKAELDALGN